MTKKTVIITRPLLQEAAHPLEAALKLDGFDLHHWPLIDTTAPSDITFVLQAWHSIDLYQAVMFVSPQAVQHFFAHRPSQLKFLNECWATGPGTREALIRAGVEFSKIQIPNETLGLWDTDQLWLRVQHRIQAGARVLVVRGGQAQNESSSSTPDVQGAGAEQEDAGVGRAYLAQQLRAQGVEVQFVVAYLRGAPNWDESQKSLAKAALINGSVWLFTSSQAAHHLVSLLPGFEFSRSKALATHERIAKQLEHMGFGVVVQSRPKTEDLLVSLKSFQ
jgi:uroporphyrinogen-III synthase